jgi:2-oxoglutarate dehydrogenase E2 component (dihydrolipoamide succinyltransferase)
VGANSGLYVPVIRDAARKSVKKVATESMVTLHHDGDILLAIPLIFPGHACALAIASPSEVPDIEDGRLTSRRVANTGLAYDHRLINGRDAAEYLRALKDLLELPLPA